MGNKAASIIRIIIAGFLSFLGTLSTTRGILFLLRLAGELNPRYRLITTIISGFISMFIGGLITARVMNSEDIWYSALNGLPVGSASAYFLPGTVPATLVSGMFSVVFVRLGGYVGLRRRDPGEIRPLAIEEI